MTSIKPAATAAASTETSDLGFDPMAERILDGALAELTDHGLRRTSIDSIAQRAGVGRATVFRRFANRDLLIKSVITRESIRFIAAADAEIASISDPAERMTTLFVCAVQLLRSNNLLNRLLATDPSDVLPYLTINAETPLTVGTEYLAAQIRRVRSEGNPGAADPNELGEILARLTLSLALTPQSVIQFDDPEQLAHTARTIIVPLILDTPAA